MRATIIISSSGGVTQTLGWTAANELRWVAVGGVAVESYRYDDGGERIVRSVAGGPVQYVYFPHYEVSVQGGVSTITRSYFFGSQRVAQKVGGGALTYLHGDHLGSTVLTTGVSGSKTYHAYGATRSGSVPTEWQYTGQEGDGTGLVYLHARYYDPATGQFLSPDTLVPEVENLYAYNRYMYGYGNPLKFSDASGHCATLEDGSPDMEGDENYACWQLAYTIYGAGFSPFTTFADDWRITPDEWLKNIASQPFFDERQLRPYAEKYSEQYLHGSGAKRYPVAWHDPPPLPRPSDRLEILRLFEGAGVCEVWDCVSVTIDVASIGVQVFRDASLFSTPVTGPVGLGGFTAGEVAQGALTVTGVAWTASQYNEGNASAADLTVSLTSAIAPRVVTQVATRSAPVVSEVATGFQLIWDLTDPLVPW